MKYHEIMKYGAAINEKAALGRRAAGPPTSRHGVMRCDQPVLDVAVLDSLETIGHISMLSCSEGMSLTRGSTKGDASCRNCE